MGVKLALCMGVESDGAFPEPLCDHFVEMDKRASDKKEDILCVDFDVLLVRVLAPSFWGDICNGSFNNFEKRLLHPFSRYVSGDRDIRSGFADFINFIDIDNAKLCFGDIIVGCL